MRNLTLLLPALFLAYSLNAQPARRIRLNPPKPRAAVSRIRITDVVDDRADTTTIGTMLGGKARTVGLEGGVAAAALAVLHRYQNPSPSARDVVMHIASLETSEKMNGPRQHLALKYGYRFVAADGELSYEGRAFAEADANVSQFTERLVRESFTTTYDKVSGAWPDPEKQVPPRLTVLVKVAPQPSSSGMISYDPKRPLTVGDFNGVPDDLSAAAAATSSGIAYSYAAQQQGAEVRVTITLTAVEDPEQSWMRPLGRNELVLAHENLHFAITANIVCRLADSLRLTTFSKEDLDSRLHEIVTYFKRKLEQEQRRYDQDTDHGRQVQQQRVWTEVIDAALRKGGCYSF